MYTLEALRQVTEDVSTARGVQERTARHVEHSAQQLDGMRAALLRSEEKIDRLTLVVEGFETRLLVALGQQGKRIAELDERLGQPPKDLGRYSQQGQHTPDELAELERGTGLAGVVGRTVAGQSKLTKRVGIVTVIGASITPAAIEIIRILTGG